MAKDAFPRRLSAIFSADAAGYSRLMRDDEDATVRTITTYRAAMTHMIQQYRGRVVDSPGDNLLAEFSSVVDAVNCAVEIQRELAERNAELLEDRKMRFRIGINLGDVIEEGQRIYGDGVNVAARMEGLAEAGGICISGAVYDAVESKIGLEYEFIGEHEIKNIDKPVRTYRVLTHPGDAAHRVIKAKRAIGKACRKGLWGLLVVVLAGAGFAAWHFYFRSPPIDPGPVKQLPIPLPTKPSIAVLPFVNMSGDPKQEYFSDGITEDIITDLSKIAGLIVISRNSSFSYKGKNTKIPVIAKELGVKYVLEGSIRKAGNEVRINAQLIDAALDHHIWADRFDGKYESIFDLQDRITNKIVSALSVNISRPEQKVIADKGTDNLLAYDEYLKGIEHVRKFTPRDYVKAIEYFKKAIAIDRNYSKAYAELAYTYNSSNAGGQRFWDAMRTDFLSARLSARHYLDLAMKNPSPRSYQVLANMELFKRNYDRAIDHAKRAVAIAPNDSDAWAALGFIMVYAGHPMKAIKYYKRSIMLDPLHKSTGGIGRAYFTMGNYEQAVKYIEKNYKDNPEITFNLAFLVAAYAFLGEDERAKEAYKNYHAGAEVRPSVQQYYYMYPFEDSKLFDRMIEGMIKAGFKAGSSGYYKLQKENRMTGQEIQETILGKTITGVGVFSPWTRKMDDIKESDVNLFSGKYRGKIWIEGDEVCQKYKTFQGRVNDCAYIYKNPQGNRKTLSEYLLLTDYWMYPFSIEE